MREIVLDTETTGLDPAEGHRVVEIGAVELFNHVPTGRTYHQYINPMRDMPAEAFAVHGISADFLSDKPTFEQIAEAFIAFVADGKLVIHNAGFDMKFLNAELVWCGRSRLPSTQSLDTLDIARRAFPGANASLDALCRRFGVDNSAREKHGALLDAEILAEVYLELVGGRQPDFALSPGDGRSRHAGAVRPQRRVGKRPAPLQPRLTEAEEQAHRALVDELGAEAVWRRYLG